MVNVPFFVIVKCNQKKKHNNSLSNRKQSAYCVEGKSYRFENQGDGTAKQMADCIYCLHAICYYSITD